MKNKSIILVLIIVSAAMLAACGGVLPLPPLHTNPSDPDYTAPSGNEFSAEAGDDQAVERSGSVSFNLLGCSSSDCDGSIFTYEWEVLSGGTGTFEGSGSSVKFIPGDSEPANYQVQLTATNAGGVKAADTVDLSVTNRVFRVDPAATGAGTGKSWADAFTSIEAALTSNQGTEAEAGFFSGDEVWVKAGRYLPQGSAGDRSRSFQMKNNVELYGGFVGIEISRSERDWEKNKTILSGDLNGDDSSNTDANGITSLLNRSDNCYHVIYNNMNGLAALDNSAVLDGFTISGGMADGVSIHTGGGFMMNNAAPVIRNCRITDNGGTDAGGMRVEFVPSAGTLVIDNCRFEYNVSTDQASGLSLSDNSGNINLISLTIDHNNDTGSGTGEAAVMIYACTGTVRLVDCSITGNSNQTGNGGGIAIGAGSTVLAENLTVSGNSCGTGFGGGGIYSYGNSSLSVNSGNFLNNAAGSSPGYSGGAIYFTGAGTLTLNKCIFSANTGDSRGGAIYYFCATEVIITDCLFEDNTTGLTGGAIYANAQNIGRLNIYNCTFSGNMAPDNPDGSGGAMVLARIPVSDIRNCTFYQNSAYKSAGAVDTYTGSTYLTHCTFVENHGGFAGALWQQDTGATAMSNCLFYNNSADTNDEFQGDNSNVTADYCVLLSTECSGGTINPSCIDSAANDSLTGDYADHGGAVPTISIAPGSSAQNAGTANMPTLPDSSVVSITTDARGYNRDSLPDIGAYEIQ